MVEGDAVPFMHILGALKSLTSLLADSSTWLQPLLQEHAVKQLQEFAASGLPALAKAYPKNQRVRELLQDIYAVLQVRLRLLLPSAHPCLLSTHVLLFSSGAEFVLATNEFQH